MARQRRPGLINSKLMDFEATSDDSSCWNYDLSGLDFQSKAEKQGIMHQSDVILGGLPKSLKGSMSISPEKMKRGQRRELRNLLRVELNKVQGLSLKLEERELQLRRRYQCMEEIYPSLSDAELSRVSPHVGVHERDSATTSNELFSQTLHPPSPHTNNPCLDDQSNPPSTTRLEAGPTKIDSEIASHCHDILKKLMKHKHGWVFNEPVDVVALGLRDYLRVVQTPMDLGTVKSKLDGHQYDSAEEFANDIRLTFSNAMRYNPQGHDVHAMADKLLHLFEANFESIQMNLKHDTNQDMEGKIVQSSNSSARIISSETHHNTKGQEQSENSKPDAPMFSNEPIREMSYEEKVILVGSLQLLPVHMQDDVIQLMRQRNPALDQKVDEMEVDVDSFSNETLWELDQYVKDCLKTAGINTKMLVQNSQHKGNTDMDQEKFKRTKGGFSDDGDGRTSSCVGASPLGHRSIMNRPWS